MSLSTAMIEAYSVPCARDNNDWNSHAGIGAGRNVDVAGSVLAGHGSGGAHGKRRLSKGDPRENETEEKGWLHRDLQNVWEFNRIWSVCHAERTEESAFTLFVGWFSKAGPSFRSGF
jgi:hypothetical protein